MSRRQRIFETVWCAVHLTAQLVYRRPLPLSVHGCGYLQAKLTRSVFIFSTSKTHALALSPLLLAVISNDVHVWSSSAPQSLRKQKRPVPPQSNLATLVHPRASLLLLLTRGQLVGQQTVTFDDSAGSIFPSQCTVSGMSRDSDFCGYGLTMTSSSHPSVLSAGCHVVLISAAMVSRWRRWACLIDFLLSSISEASCPKDWALAAKT